MSIPLFFAEHSYLAATLLGLVPVVLCYVWAREQRGRMALSGLILTLYSPGASLSNGDYWNPHRLGGFGFGIEDMICGFSMGSLIWLAAEYPFRKRVQTGYLAPVFWGRIATVSLSFTAGLVALWLGGFGSVSAEITMNLLLILALLALRRDYWPVTLGAALIYTPYYCLVLFVVSWIFPEFFSLWNGPTLWGSRLFDLPWDEYTWVSSFAGSWALMIAYALELRWQDAIITSPPDLI